jgi:hypothetical protein
MLLLLKTVARILDMHSKLLTWIVSGFLSYILGRERTFVNLRQDPSSGVMSVVFWRGKTRSSKVTMTVKGHIS